MKGVEDAGGCPDCKAGEHVGLLVSFMTRTEFASWVKRRLTPGQYFGLQLTLGATLFTIAAWIFGGIAEEVARGEPVTTVDDEIARWFRAHEIARVTRAMSLVSTFHTWPISMLASAFLAYLLARRRWIWALFGSCAVAGGIALNTVLKIAFHRERPTLSGLASALYTYSFPSGHTLAATLVYGVLAAYAVRHTSTRAARVAIVAGAISAVSLVAFSRLYLGVHYLTDVLAAVAEGVAWLALCYTAAQTFVGHRARIASRAAR